jgi:predicted phage terminase large subunit-like protein
VMREKLWDWWLSTARSRLQRGGVVILVMTRWHEDDLAGRLLAQAAEDPEADQWELLELPAIADPDPETGELYDALGRGPGEALCPELGFDEAWARQTKASVGTYWWSALYQQRPRPAEGLLFKQHDFRYWEPHPGEPGLMILYGDEGRQRTQSLLHCAVFETVDVAASEKQTADYTVISKWAVTPDRDLILIDRRRQHFEIVDVGGFVKASHDDPLLTSLPPATWTGWKCPTASFTDVESFGHGLTVVQELIPQGYPIRRIEPDTDKVSRALVAVARYEEHRVYHPRLASWRREWEDELLAFPTGKNDDQVDTVSMAAERLPSVPVGQRTRRERKGSTLMGGIRDREM